MKRRLKKPQIIVKRKKGRLDVMLLLFTLVLTLFGIVMVYDASVVEAYRSFSDKYYFAKQQFLWAGIGISLMLGLSFLPYRALRKIGVWLFFVTLLLLIVVLIPTFSFQALGARRWIRVGNLTVQPAELVKLTMIIYLASYLEKKKRLPQFLFIIALIIGLIMLEPDLGTTVVVSLIALNMYFLSGASISGLLLLVFTAVVAGVLFIFSSPYRKARVATFLNPTQDPLGASYHIRQVLIALGSGGLFGVGIGRSKQKYEYIPAATTDSIFAIMAEEIGFIGSAVVIGMFLVVLSRAFRIAKRAPDKFGTLLAGGIAGWIGFQILLNLSTMVALVPLTGVPLPFISYGGSSTVSILAAMGILLNISRYQEG